MAVKKANPMQTRTGKPRLGPLNLKQLKELHDKTQKAKVRAQIQKRIEILEKKQNV